MFTLNFGRYSFIRLFVCQKLYISEKTIIFLRSIGEGVWSSHILLTSPQSIYSGKKVWMELDRNVSIQFKTVFENYVSIQKNIKEVKETDWIKSTYQIGIKT